MVLATQPLGSPAPQHTSAPDFPQTSDGGPTIHLQMVPAEVQVWVCVRGTRAPWSAVRRTDVRGVPARSFLLNHDHTS